MNILAISGSLRKNSLNSALTRVLVNSAPEGFSANTASIIDKLPFFNPDIDDIENPHDMVKQFRELLRKADGLVIVSPEYAHNIPGVLKNALDWVVASGELVNKPIVVINVSPSFMGGDKAHASLKYLVKLLSARLVEEASFLVSGAKGKFDAEGNLMDAEVILKINQVYEHFKRMHGHLNP